MSDGSGLRIASPVMRLTEFAALPDDSEFSVELSPAEPSSVNLRYNRDNFVDVVSWHETKKKNRRKTAGFIIGG